MKKCRWLWLMMLSAMLLITPISVQAADVSGASVYNNSNITFTPDGQSWTTDFLETDYEKLTPGHTLTTGVTSSLPQLQVGQHEYPVKKNGLVSIEKWVVYYAPGHCIHNDYWHTTDYHGLTVGQSNCLQFYKNGWLGFCADCHQDTDILFYMDEATAATLKRLPLEMDYFYMCPHCDNMEQARTVEHECKDISWNKYTVEYVENGSKVNGIMSDSTFMYNNETMYEGQKITPDTRLRKNRFQREGYEFVGWSTLPDGTGDFFEDEEDVFNLTAVNGGIITLYAQWQKSESTLHIHPGSGKLDGESGIVSVTQKYGTTLDVSGSRLTPPRGAIISFDTNGGSAVEDMQTTRYFKEWSLSYPFHGELKDEIYHFTGADGSEDTITAIYGHEAITLPDTQKEGVEFGGWYKDEECTQLVGPAGAEVIITQNTTLYAQWVSLQLTATDDYSVYGGSGAVDLTWVNAENTLMTYLVYQMREGGTWTKLQQMLAEDSTVDETFTATGEARTYTIPYSGLYTLTLTGAQGESYAYTTDTGETTMAGGKGGRVKATVFLHAGEILTCNIGTSTGYNGGGSGSLYGNGGGMTSISSNKKGTLLIAGGGGGASALLEGGPGGAETSLTTNSNGGSGYTGGGGGYLGGNAGEAIYHAHKDAECHYHEHDGDEATGGACYEAASCGGMEFSEGGGGLWYTNPHWSNNGSGICVQCGYDFGNGINASDAHEAYYPKTYTCKTCDATYQNKRPSFCTADGGYTLSCTIPEGYNCGKTEKTVEGTKTAYGGSNYTNETYCTLLVTETGVGIGDGTIHIYLESLEYMDTMELLDVQARDMAAPEKIAEEQISKIVTGDSQLQVSWTEPVDKGTLYRHQVAAHELSQGEEVCRSNITENTLTSGIRGYYYLLDEQATTRVTADNSSLGRESTCTVALREYEQYLHVAAVDVAGNLSESVHVRIARDDTQVPWPITTGSITISGDEGNVYQSSEREWYVRADGETGFMLQFGAEMAYGASASYQINYMDFLVDNGLAGESFSIYAPNHPVGISYDVYDVGELIKQVDGVLFLEDGVYTRLVRSNAGNCLEVTQKFLIDAVYDGQRFQVMPSAGADWGEQIIRSDTSMDEQNGLWLRADGTAPEITGVDALSLWDGREDTFSVQLSAMDRGCGMREFYCIIQNKEQYSRRRIDAPDRQHLMLEMLPTDSLLEGDVEIHIYAVDNVGNYQHVVVDNPFFSMQASVKRLRSPQDAAFRAGDSGLLQVDTYGYADSIEIEYPTQWRRWGFEDRLVIDYGEDASYHQQEIVQFMVPLEATDGIYEFPVRAHKAAGQSLEKILQIRVEGSILDELHTRLR